MLKKDEVDLEEEKIRIKINNLDDEKRKVFYKDVKDKLKDPDTYAVLNWFFIAGLHHFYLEKWKRGVFNLSIFIIGIIFLSLSFFEIGFFIIIIISVIELGALFNSQVIVQDYNNKVYEDTLNKIK
ncbi:hypothetical protein [Halarcobacter sp.]|uniref:hypothetical protein n=1 Tax=Halarcobacter sp. TaxID=2321133 RepID=UPI002AA7E564|nr:hypothetical protein [Halarcobacter sp.]